MGPAPCRGHGLLCACMSLQDAGAPRARTGYPPKKRSSPRGPERPGELPKDELPKGEHPKEELPKEELPKEEHVAGWNEAVDRACRGAGRQGLGMSRGLRLRSPCLASGEKSKLSWQKRVTEKQQVSTNTRSRKRRGASKELLSVPSAYFRQSRQRPSSLRVGKSLRKRPARVSCSLSRQCVSFAPMCGTSSSMKRSSFLFARRSLSSLLMMNTTQGMTTRWMHVSTSLGVGLSLPAASNASARGFSSSTSDRFSQPRPQPSRAYPRGTVPHACSPCAPRRRSSRGQSRTCGRLVPRLWP